jgi:MFS family permease
MIGALKRDPMPSGAALSFVAGPILSPILFGHGGWNWWQSLVVLIVTGLVLLSSLSRRRMPAD